MKKKLLPFSWLPGFWGLKGKTYEKARAEYELEGDELNIRLAEIEFGKDSQQVKTCRLTASFNSGIINDYELGQKLIDLAFCDKPDDIEKKKRLVQLDKEHKKITDQEFDKQIYTLDNKPWVTIRTNVDPKNAAKLGEVEIDWNEMFIAELKKQNYNGAAEDIIIKKWFTAVCSAVALEGGFITPPVIKPDKDSPNLNFREYE